MDKREEMSDLKDLEVVNRGNMEAAIRVYKEFVESFESGFCNVCEKDLSYFNEDEPCLHWFLIPGGFRKKHFSLIYQKFDRFQIESYLRWVASQEKIFENINDLVDERSPNNVFHTTIKYKEFEWVITCSKGDLEGHKDSRNGKFPHYHISMRLGGRRFVDFKDHHVPLTKLDLHKLDLIMNNKVIHQWVVGGMQDAMQISLKEILRLSRISPGGSGTYHIGTFLELDNISSNETNRALMRSKETGETIAKILSDIEGAKAEIFISPGDGVPDMVRRDSPRSKKKISKKIRVVTT